MLHEGDRAQMPDDETNQQTNNEEEKGGSRMDAAKAFFRAMYAGEEPASEEKAPAASPGDSRRIKELEQQLKEQEQKAQEAENLYKRMAADFDNFRRRMEREREEFTNVGVKKAAEAIIPALDDLDRAMMYLSAETPADKLIESFKLVANRITQCLEQAGLKRLQTTGGVIFDPRYHEPVQQIETTEHPDQSIMHELRGGYMLGDRVLRPALVNVASNSSMTVTPMPELNPPAAQPAAAAAQAQPESQPASVATATEEKTDKTEAGQAAAEPEDGSRVYDLGNLDA